MGVHISSDIKLSHQANHQSLLLTEEEREKLIDLANRLLKAMHKTGFEKIMIYQDEASSGNLHINFIPRHEWTYQFHANFGEMGVYAKKNLNINDEYKKELLDCIEKIKRGLLLSD